MNPDSRVTGTPYEVVMASPIIVRNGYLPVRIVLCKKEDEYVTWEEGFYTETPMEGPSGSSCKFVHHSFSTGGYHTFKSEKRPFATKTEQEARWEAEQEYKERVRKLFNV